MDWRDYFSEKERTPDIDLSLMPSGEDDRFIISRKWADDLERSIKILVGRMEDLKEKHDESERARMELQEELAQKQGLGERNAVVPSGRRVRKKQKNTRDVTEKKALYSRKGIAGTSTELSDENPPPFILSHRKTSMFSVGSFLDVEIMSNNSLGPKERLDPMSSDCSSDNLSAKYGLNKPDLFLPTLQKNMGAQKQ